MGRVAVIGTGIQGTGIAERLASAGHALVVHDRVAAQTLRAAEAGARVVETAAEAIRSADLVLVVLPAGDAPLHLLAHPDTLRALRPGQLVLQLGSTRVDDAHRMAERVRATGARFAECVLAGPIAAVLDGTCELLFGGAAEDLAEAEPVLARIGRPRHVGGVGAASAFNLAALAQVYATLAGFYTACGMVERSGLDVATYLDFVKGGVAGHPGAVMADFLWPVHLERRAYPLVGPVQVRNDCALEETRMLAEHARALHLAPALLDALAAAHRGAAERDPGADWSSVYDVLARPRPRVAPRDRDDEDAGSARPAADAGRRLREAGLPFAGTEMIEAAGLLRVRDGMNRRVARVYEDATLEEVAELLGVTQASDLAVVTRDQRFVGVVSEGDVIRALLPDFDEVLHARGSTADARAMFVDTAARARLRPIAPFIIREPLTLSPDEHLLTAAAIFVDKMIRRLPVVDDGRLVGTLSRGDLCWVLLNEGPRR